MSIREGQHAERNRLLLALSGAEYARLLPSLEVVPLPAGHILHQAHEAIAQIYFPQRCVVSIVVDEKGERAELQTIGNEGVVGLSVFLGDGFARARTMAHVPDHAVRIGAAAFRRALGRSAPFRKVLLRYTETVLGRLARTAVCHRLHRLEARCARCLLTTQDRVGAEHFFLTQASLAQMVGVRRPSVARAAAELREAGLIHYSRGHLTIADRIGLESASCSCYAVLRADYEGLVGPLEH